MERELWRAQLAALRGAPVGIAFVDQELRYLIVNEAAAEMCGVPVEAHLGRTPSEVLPPGDETEIILHRLRYVLRTGQPLVGLEVDWLAPGEPPKRRFSRMSYHPVREGMEVVGVCVYLEDITEQKLADEARRASDVWLRQLFDSRLIGILVWDWRGGIIDANGRFLELVGHRRDDLRDGRLDWKALIAPGLAGVSEPTAEGCLARETPVELELCRRDGTRVPVLGVGAFFEGSVTEGVSFFLDITEQKRAQAAVREGEARMRSLVAALSEGIILQDSSGTIVFANAAASRLLGLPTEELLGQSILDARWSAVREDDSPCPAEEHPVRLALELGVPQLDKVLGFQRQDGSRVWFSINALPLTGPDGKSPMGMVASFFDITRRKAVEEALRVSDDRLRMAVSSAAIGTWDFDPATRRLEWDARCKALFGLPPDAKVDYGVFLAGLHPDDRERMHRIVQQALTLESGGILETEYRTLGRQDHVERWIATKGRAWFDDKGHPFRCIGTVMDITQRKRTESRTRLLSEAARILSERLEGVEDMLQRVARIAASHLATWCVMSLMEEGGRMIRVATAHRDPEKEGILRATARFAPRVYQGERFAEMIRAGKPVLTRDTASAFWRRIAVNSEHMELLDALDTGSMMLVPLKRRGRVLGLLCMGGAAPHRRFDAEDLALAEELGNRVAAALENIRLYREAQQAVGLRDEFLSVASHELKTPLTSLKLQHELIGRCLEPGSAALIRPRLEAAVRQVSRLSSLVDSLLDVSRITSGRLVLEPRELDLTQLVREALERLSQMIDQAGCSVDFPPSPPVRGCWDPLRLDQVIVNLLSNAARFGAGKPLHVRVEVREKCACLTIRDEGIGIASEDLPRLFSRFGRAVSQRHYGGLGLGLYISKQILEAMGGSIHVESQPTLGATFVVELPRTALARGTAPSVQDAR